MNKINKTLLKRKLKSAGLVKNKLDCLCEDISEIIKPLHNKEISVFYQESDGFVVVFDADDVKEAPKNIPISEYL